MQTILVTGATGLLGREVVQALSKTAARVVTLDRRRSGAGPYGDLLTGKGLAEAFQGIDVIVHAATSRNTDIPKKAVEDLQMTEHLLSAARQAGVRHIVYIGITGIDGGTYDYFKAKVGGEQLVMRSGIPYTIQRSAHFFDFIPTFLQSLRLGPVQFYPVQGQLQPVDVRAVGEKLAQLALQASKGRIENDLAGPDILNFETLARSCSSARWLVPLPPLPIPGLQEMQSGQMVPVRPHIIGQTWQSWLTNRQDNAGQ